MSSDRPTQPVRLLALDVDGTILNRQSQLEEPVRAAIERAKTAGIKVVLCTGRRFRRASAIAEMLGLDTPMVTNSGALVKCPGTNRTLWAAAHSPGDFQAIISVFQAHGRPILSFLDTRPDEPDFVTSAYPSGCALFDHYLAENLKFGQVVPDWLAKDDAASGHFHLCAAGTREAMQQIADQLHRQRPDGFQIFVQKSPAYVAWMCEVLRRDANKWTALKTIADEMKIGTEAICAVGDDANDVPMIENAGWGVAMGHSEAFVHEKAHWSCPPNHENGLVEAINRVLESL
jgi:Cof subfamily protein (haloacid dehalogenase superfamily)